MVGGGGGGGAGGGLVKHIKVDWALATHRVKGTLCSQSDWKRWGGHRLSTM